MSLDNLTKLVQQHRVEFVDLKFSDLQGAWHHLTIPVSALKEELFQTGVGIDGSSLPGFSSIERGDMILLPDPSTAFVDPFFESPTLSMIGDIMLSEDTIVSYSRDPRRVARDSEKLLAQTLKGVQVILGPEFEFYIFDKVNFHQGPDSAFYTLDAAEAPWQASDDEENLGFKIPYKKGYHVGPPQDRTYNLRNSICSMLKNVGIELKYHHHEVGGGGQHEIEVKFAPLLAMADMSLLVKYIVKNEAFRQHKSATFMPKPLFNEPGSGLHVHQYLADKNGSLFFDANGPAKFSQLGRYYLGGVLKHVDSLLAFSNPSTNSFKRLVPGFEAPVMLAYSARNRSASIRIPWVSNPKARRIEVRFPDSTANPYFAFASMMMAGLDGIQNKIHPGEASDKDLYDLPPEEAKNIPEVCHSLDMALDHLDRDREFLKRGGVFSDDLIDAYIGLKQAEVTRFRMSTHPVEFDMYYSL